VTRTARRRALQFSAMLLALAMAGCASVPSAPPSGTEQVITGRFSVSAQGNGRSDSGAGRFTLTTAGPSLTLDLSTPLGTTLARLERDAKGARLNAPRDDGAMTTLQGTDPEGLLQDAFGWAIPVDGLADWIAGRPAPGTAARVQRDTAGSVSTIEQSGWTIEIQERFAGPSGTPRRLLATRPASGPAPSLTLRLVLDEPGTPAQ
jgi:outer membrane lipoprotein LolB